MADPFVTSLTKKTVASLKATYADLLSAISDEALETELQAIVAEILPEKLVLTTSRPDYESILYRFVQELEASDAWTDVSLAGTGQMFLRAVAAHTAYGQFSLARDLQEAFPHTARNESSIYANARALGVRLQRRQPAQVTVVLIRPENNQALSIPQWSRFMINGVPYFNRLPDGFLATQTNKTLTLHQGEIKTETIISTGARYQDLEVGFENWRIADTDIRVTVDTLEYTRTEKPLFLFNKTDRVFYDNTLPNGNAELRFGNGIHGVGPAASLRMVVQWVETLGADAPPGEIGLQVNWVDAPNGIRVDGQTLTIAALGNNEPGPSYYKVFSSDLRAGGGAAHRRADHRAKAIEFPGVYDARFRGQAELNPGRPSAMNLVGVTLLTDPPFTDSQWQQFAAFFESAVPFKPTLIRMDPQMVPIDIEYDIYCLPGANLEAIRAALDTQIRAAFAPKIDSLGYNFYVTDINTVINSNGEIAKWVSYTKAILPVADVELTGITQWIRINEVKLNMFYSSRENYSGRIE